MSSSAPEFGWRETLRRSRSRPYRRRQPRRPEVERRVRDALLNSNSAIAADFNFLQMDDLSNEQAVSLVERHIVSPEFIANSKGRGILISKDESISIMVNEEDHVRIQILHEGRCAFRNGRDGRPDRYAFKRKPELRV